MGILKAMPVILTIAFLLVGTIAMSATARIEGRWALQTGDVLVGEDISIQKPQASIFHQQTASAVDIEHLDIDFPISADNLGLGPSSLGLGVADASSGTGGIASSSGADGSSPFGSVLSQNNADALGIGASATDNILPFGPVNLAFPAIEQDTTQQVKTTNTGFFTANWAFMADTASSNLGTEPLGIYPASGHPFKNPKMLGSEFIWPYMIPAASAADGSLSLDMNSLSPGLVPDVPSLGTDVSIIKRNTVDITSDVKAPANATTALNTMRAVRAANATNATKVTTAANATNTTAKQKPEGWGQRKPRINPKMTKENIKNATTLQRTYRNAFIGSTMHNAYEGPTQYPIWIDPYDKGMGVFNLNDRNKMIELAMKKTVPGARIAPVFWDL